VPAAVGAARLQSPSKPLRSVLRRGAGPLRPGLGRDMRWVPDEGAAPLAVAATKSACRGQRAGLGAPCDRAACHMGPLRQPTRCHSRGASSPWVGRWAHRDGRTVGRYGCQPGSQGCSGAGLPERTCIGVVLAAAAAAMLLPGELFRAGGASAGSAQSHTVSSWPWLRPPTLTSYPWFGAAGDHAQQQKGGRVRAASVAGHRTRCSQRCER
jgi:hypothetical protein